MKIQCINLSNFKNLSNIQKQNNKVSNNFSNIHTLNNLNDCPLAHLNRANVFFGSQNSMKSEPVKDAQYYKEELKSYLGFEAEIDEDGLLILPYYSQPDQEITFVELGIDEDDMFKHIKEITGWADFTNSSIKSLGNLTTIGGYADFQYSKVESLGKLSSIGGYADFSNSPIKSLGNLEMIDGHADFRDTQIGSLGKLKTVMGDVIVDNDDKNIKKLFKKQKHKIMILGDIVSF